MRNGQRRADVARRTFALGVQGVTIVIVLLALLVATRALGLHWTLTESLPRGVYQHSDAPLVRGTLVAFCLPHAHAAFAWQRGYIAGVPDLPVLRECPGGYQPLLKPIVASAGDVINLTPESVIVNGEPIAQSQTQEQDRAGRALPHVVWGRYVLTNGELWVMSTYHPASWDSRYFGPIRAETVIATVVPLWVWPTQEEHP
jgi:conjugative transfer signal peptidase TraF